MNSSGKAEASAESEADSKPRPRKQSRPDWPETLPVSEEVLIPEPVKAAPDDWRCIGEEVSEQLDYEPARFLRRRIIRRKYVHRRDADQPPILAPLPESLQERCTVAPGLLAQLIVAKYCDHLPLYRQEQIYRTRHDVHLPRQSMARWLALAADWLKPIYQIIRTGVMGGGYLQVDETPIDYLQPGNGRASKGYLWTYHRPGGDVVFDWQTGRAATCLDNVIPHDFSGTIQCDGYAAYRTFARSRTTSSITLAGCWAHARRKFHEAREQAPKQTAWVLRQIQHLYRIEADLRRSKAGSNLRLAHRQHQGRPIHRRIQRALIALKATGRYLPQSLFAQAIDYTLAQWPMLSVWLANGQVEIDNNLVENAIRPTAIGKKNWLFIGDANAGQRGAILYTLVESCRRRGIDPYAYLRDLLTRLPSMTNWQLKDVTPEAWAKSSRRPLLQAAS